MKRQLHDLIGLLLIGALFLIEIPRYAETLPDQSQFVAIGMGLLLSGGAFYTIETWGMLRRKRGTPRGTNRLLVMTALLILVAPVIMTPPMVAHQNGVSTNDVLATLGNYTEELVWLFIVTIIPVATGVFVAYARSLQYSSAELNEPARARKTLSDAGRALSETPLALGDAAGASLPEPARYTCACGRSDFRSQQALAGHQRSCSAHKALNNNGNGANRATKDKEKIAR
jgi:hypothetical protein